MKNFKFLRSGPDLSGFRPELINRIYEMCREYKDFITKTMEDFLLNNPHIDPNSEYEYPIPIFEQVTVFPEGKLWHGGSDYDAENDMIFHYTFLDELPNDEGYCYYFETEENGDEFIIYNVTYESI